MQRLLTRDCADLSGDTDYFHGVQHIYAAAEVIRHMTTLDPKANFFSPDLDTVRKTWRAQRVGSMDPPYTVVLPDPAEPGRQVREPITRRQVSLPGWPGAAPTLTPQEMEAKVEEWKRAIALAEGRRHQVTLFTPAGQLPSMVTCATILGFPTAATLYRFAYRPAVREAFRELWDAALGRLHSDREIPGSRFGRRPVALRIFYTRRRGDESEFNAEEPDKAGWGLASHLARFCLRVETVCNAERLPPMRGQVPVLSDRASSSTVAWSGVELARVLRRTAKGFSAFPDRMRYLDDDTPAVEGV